MNLEDHIGKQIESHPLAPAGGVVLTKLEGLFTASPKLVDPDRDEVAGRFNRLPSPETLATTPRQKIALTGAPPVNKPQCL